MRRALVLLLFAAPWMHDAAAVDDAALARCRGIADNAARVACYDALPLGAPQAGAAPAAPQAQPSSAVPIVIPAAQFGC